MAYEGGHPLGRSIGPEVETDKSKIEQWSKYRESAVYDPRTVVELRE